jgi:nucleotide-binding universal stress UspA family protein
MSHGIPLINRTPALDTYSGRSSDAAVPAGNVTTFESVRHEFTGKKYRVLLAHDLTGPSEIALVRAIRLTLEREGHLAILHVVSSGLATDVNAARRAHAKRHLENEIRRWAGGPRLSYSTDVGIGDVPGAIAARAKAHNIDLIVTGRHRRSTLAEAFTPSIVARLLQRSHRPVLVVGNSNQCAYQRVFMPVDLTTASAARVRFAATFLPHARLHLLLAHRRRFPNCFAAGSLMRDQGEMVAGQPSERSGQQSHRALSRLIESLVLERRPIVTFAKGELLALVKEELARQKTDLLVLGIHARSSDLLPGRAVGIAALRASSCDILFPSRDGLS